jgi:hypothetical protein
VLGRRAVENYFTQLAIDLALGRGKHRALEAFEPLKTALNHWPKKKNWRIARSITKAELDQTDLGKVLASI